ncbi:MAG: autotransporter-associated beta strand repeat-containing protein, partial [Akkermansia sp.]
IGEATGGGTMGIVKDGVGSLTLSGANTYTGSTTLKNGILILGHAGALGATNSLVVNGKATLKSTLTNGAYTLKSLNLTGGSLNMGGTGSAQ